MAQFSVEVEYVSTSMVTSYAISSRRILEDLEEKQIKETKIFCDNKSAIAMAKNLVYHNHTRHITLKHHFIRETFGECEIQLKYCNSNNQVADIYTKPLPRDKF